MGLASSSGRRKKLGPVLRGNSSYDLSAGLPSGFPKEGQLWDQIPHPSLHRTAEHEQCAIQLKSS